MATRMKLASILVLLGQLACGSTDAVTGLNKSGEVPLPATLNPDEEELVARALAISLGDDRVRLRVRDDLRASLWVDHKVDLKALIQSEGSAPLRERMANGMHLSADDLLAMTASLPAYDFSLVREKDRLTWQGTPNILVALAPRDEAGAVVAFDSDGARHSLSSPDQLGGRVLLLLQPAEHKNLRINPQPPTAGSVIQDANDGRLGGEVTLNVDGKAVTFDFAQIGPNRQQQCPEPELCPGGGGGGGGGSSGSEGSTYVEDIQTDGICDNGGFICGSNELEFKGQWVYGSSTVTGTARITGVPAVGVLGGVHGFIMAKQPTDFVPITIIEVKETDVLDADDHFCGDGSPYSVVYDTADDSFTGYYQKVGSCGVQYRIHLVAVFEW